MMINRLKNIITWFNLLGLNSIQKQALDTLLLIKKLTKDHGYTFDYNSLLEVRLTQYFSTKRDDVLVNLDKKPLTTLPLILKYLQKENFLEKDFGNNYCITPVGLNRAFEVESFYFLSLRLATWTGIFGGLIYALNLVADFIGFF